MGSISINWAAVAIFFTILCALIGMAVAWGTNSEKIKQNREKTEINAENIRRYQDENRQDHKQIFDKLDALRDLIKNGH